jgi:hypothetical protein
MLVYHPYSANGGASGFDGFKPEIELLVGWPCACAFEAGTYGITDIGHLGNLAIDGISNHAIHVIGWPMIEDLRTERAVRNSGGLRTKESES